MRQKLFLLLALALSFVRGVAAETDSSAVLTTPMAEQFSASVEQTATNTMEVEQVDFTTNVTLGAQSSELPGDMNGDGKVNINEQYK